MAAHQPLPWHEQYFKEESAGAKPRQNAAQVPGRFYIPPSDISCIRTHVHVCRHVVLIYPITERLQFLSQDLGTAARCQRLQGTIRSGRALQAGVHREARQQLQGEKNAWKLFYIKAMLRALRRLCLARIRDTMLKVAVVCGGAGPRHLPHQ